MRWAIRSSQPPSLRARSSERTLSQHDRAGDQHDEADHRELERTRLGRVTCDEQTGGGDQRQGKRRQRLE